VNRPGHRRTARGRHEQHSIDEVLSLLQTGWRTIEPQASPVAKNLDPQSGVIRVAAEAAVVHILEACRRLCNARALLFDLQRLALLRIHHFSTWAAEETTATMRMRRPSWRCDAAVSA